MQSPVWLAVVLDVVIALCVTVLCALHAFPIEAAVSIFMAIVGVRAALFRGGPGGGAPPRQGASSTSASSSTSSAPDAPPLARLSVVAALFVGLFEIARASLGRALSWAPLRLALSAAAGTR